MSDQLHVDVPKLDQHGLLFQYIFHILGLEPEPLFEPITTHVICTTCRNQSDMRFRDESVRSMPPTGALVCAVSTKLGDHRFFHCTDNIICLFVRRGDYDVSIVRHYMYMVGPDWLKRFDNWDSYVRPNAASVGRITLMHRIS